MKILIVLLKLLSRIIQKLHLGSGATWPGEILLMINPDAFSYFSNKFEKGIILIAGTNGKTTTSSMISSVLENEHKNSVVRNSTGANLTNGLVSACIQSSDYFGNSDFDWGVFEVDENSLPAVISNFSFGKLQDRQSQNSNKKIIVVLLNLFRDQLDRYGEVDAIARKWETAIKLLPPDTTLLLNADDPQIAYFGKDKKHKVLYFGVEQKEKYLKIKEHATDSTYCPFCRFPLKYEGVYFSHIGVWECNNCGFIRPSPKRIDISSHLAGLYSRYNLYASFLAGVEVGIEADAIKSTLSSFKPAFGRQEEILYKGRKVKIFLSKNPAGFNASLRAVLDLNPYVILLVLNDRIPDGRDVSWIYDVDFEMIPDSVSIICSGDRVYDLGVRIKYSMKQFNHLTMKQLVIEEKVSDALNVGIDRLNSRETLYVLPTYSAMLETRKILTGKKIS